MSGKVAIVMGSKSDWEYLQLTQQTLASLQITAEPMIVSAHRTPKRLYQFAETARSQGYAIIIAGAGGAAHLPGMLAALTPLPVIGVPVPSKHLNGMDSLLSIVQMPKGVPVGTMSIGNAGAINAALFAASILALHDANVAAALEAYRKNQTESVELNPLASEV